MRKNLWLILSSSGIIPTDMGYIKGAAASLTGLILYSLVPSKLD